MKIWIETRPTAGGDLHDLVLVQDRAHGLDTIRLGLIAPDAEQALRELTVWLQDNTMDTIEIMRREGSAA